MNKSNTQNIHTYLLLLFASLIITTYSDCPISRYHSSFKLGINIHLLFRTSQSYSIAINRYRLINT